MPGVKLAKIVREHKKDLTAIAKVQKYQKQTDAKLEGIGENASEEHDDEYHGDDIENPSSMTVMTAKWSFCQC